MAQFRNLPGIETQFRDNQLLVSRPGVTTSSVLILGTAVDGPVNTVYQVNRLEDAEKVFGPSGTNGIWNNTTLIRAMYELYNAGCRDIRLMRITGSAATAELRGPSNTKTVVKSITEAIGFSAGNTNCMIDITSDTNPEFGPTDEVLPGSVQVYADDVLVSPNLYTVNYDAGTVTLPANVVKGGASIRVVYKKITHTDTQVTDAPFWNSDGEGLVWRPVNGEYTDWKAGTLTVRVRRIGVATTPNTDRTVFTVSGFSTLRPMLSSPAPVVYINGVVDTTGTVDLNAGTITYASALGADKIVTIDYTYNATADCVPDLIVGKITFISAIATTCLVTADFTYDKKTIVAETGDPPVPLSVEAVANGANQTLKLSYTPIPNDPMKPFKLYVGGVEVQSSNYYINYESNEVTLLANRVDVGKSVTANYYYNLVIDSTPVIKYRTTSAGSKYNYTALKVTRIHEDNDLLKPEIGKKITLIKPASKKLSAREQDLTYTSLDYVTFKDLVKAMNEDQLNNVVFAEVDDAYAATLTANIHIPVGQEEITIQFTGGSDGLDHTIDEIYNILGGVRDEAGNVVTPGVYDLLINYPVDIIVPVVVCENGDGIYADQVLEGDHNFAEQLANFCANCALRNNEVIGVIPVKPISPSKINLAGIQEYVDALLARKNEYYYRDELGNYVLDGQGNKADIGRYVNVVVGEVFFASNSLGTYSNNFALAYAGLVSTLSPGSSTLNKLIPNAQGLKFEFSPSQHDALIGAGYVTLQNKFGRGIVVVDGVTAALPTSDFRRLTTLRIAHAAAHLVRLVCDRYVGARNNTPTRNAMATDINHALKAMKDAGDLQDYAFSIISSGADQQIGRVVIELNIIPVFEIRNITIIVSNRPAL